SRSTLRSAAALCAAFALASIPTAARPQALALGLAMPAAHIRPALVVVPDVRGQTLSGAAVRVANVGLVPRHAASAPGDLDTSPVRRQWPRAGQRVPEGTVVALELATPAAAPARAPAVRSAAEIAEGSAAWLARTSLTASFEVRERAGGAPGSVFWWIAAAAGVSLLALALRTTLARRAAAPLAPPRDAAIDEARPSPGEFPATGALGRLGHGVWVKRTRRVPRLAIALAGSIVATEVAEV
ncbi:MAG TPA: PASTA domain-containing protein, partial [Longimicrobium sp.]|nr:PASTA domain-containing protein [Longimicrobium sp.]